ncbi:MAG TPA: hypothetical protein VJR68_17810 [Dyella sp.]|nr:hypothetical protein [Dyella sp.]
MLVLSLFSKFLMFALDPAASPLMKKLPSIATAVLDATASAAAMAALEIHLFIETPDVDDCWRIKTQRPTTSLLRL